MNEQNSIPNRTAPVWYATHGNHLHAYRFEEEAAAHAAEFGGSYYSSFEVLSALHAYKGLAAIAVAAASLLAADGTISKALAYGELRRTVLEHGAALVNDIESGKLDGVYDPARLEATKADIAEYRLIEKAQANIDRRVTVVRQPASFLNGNNIVGRSFEIAALNPVTDHVRIEVAGVDGEVDLTPDEYVFADEATQAAPSTVAPTTDKLRD